MRCILTIVMWLSFLDVWADGDIASKVNAAVARIDTAIGKGEVTTVTVSGNEESEGRPPVIRYFTERGQLVASSVEVGHETWSSRIIVHFYNDSKPMKYGRTVKGRGDRPSREAIIYAQDGEIVWKNVNAPMIDPAHLVNLYRAIETIRSSAAQY